MHENSRGVGLGDFRSVSVASIYNASQQRSVLQRGKNAHRSKCKTEKRLWDSVYNVIIPVLLQRASPSTSPILMYLKKKLLYNVSNTRIKIRLVGVDTLLSSKTSEIITANQRYEP